MDSSDPRFGQVVETLKKLAREGASVAVLLETAKEDIGDLSSSIAAVLAFRRAFDIPLFAATSLGGWAGFNERGEGVSSEQLESEWGELIRSHIR